jgi:hypothetical protein
MKVKPLKLLGKILISAQIWLGAMNRSGLNYFTKSATEVSKDGKHSVTASHTYVPFMGYMNDCKGRDLSESPKDLMKSNKK